MSDGFKKNLEVLWEEAKETGADFMRNVERLKSPSLNPKNRKHFVPHVLKAFISTFFGMRRILTEVVTWYILIRIIVFLWSLFS